jgi:light-regulated signal transduction histidine kinase (bacteriophytochrome)
LIIEWEVAEPEADHSSESEGALQAIPKAASIRSLRNDTAEIFRQFAGYYRVMLYRFDEKGHGEVLSEVRHACWGYQ